MDRFVQVVPRSGVRLYGAMVKKQRDLQHNAASPAFYRQGNKLKDRAKWVHVKHKGWVNLERTSGEIVSIQVKSRSDKGDEWQLFHTFLGWLDRHFRGDIAAVNIQYRQDEE